MLRVAKQGMGTWENGVTGLSFRRGYVRGRRHHTLPTRPLTEAAAKGRPFSFREPWVASSAEIARREVSRAGIANPEAVRAISMSSFPPDTPVWLPPVTSGDFR
jgi:hypothetical protein